MKLLIICLITAITFAMMTVSGNVYTLNTESGKAQINAPYTLKLREDISTATNIVLVKPGDKVAAVRIVIQEPYGLDLKSFAAGMVGEDKQYKTTSTDDSHAMLFYALDAGLNRAYQPAYNYYAFIDQLDDKKVIVEIFGDSRTSDLNKDEYQKLCKSFTFTNGSRMASSAVEAIDYDDKVWIAKLFDLNDIIQTITPIYVQQLKNQEYTDASQNIGWIEQHLESGLSSIEEYKVSPKYQVAKAESEDALKDNINGLNMMIDALDMMSINPTEAMNKIKKADGYLTQASGHLNKMTNLIEAANK